MIEPDAVRRRSERRRLVRSPRRRAAPEVAILNVNCQSRDERPFHHYTTKHRVVSWISRRLFDSVTYTVRHGLIKGMRRKGGLAWLPKFITGSTETPEETFWRNRDLRNLVIYDVGAFRGVLTLFFARQGRQVISYEPNTRNHARDSPGTFA